MKEFVSMAEVKTMTGDSKEPTVIPTACAHDCGGRCILRAHVVDGVIKRIETDDGEEPQLRACLRGRAYRQRVNHPDRLRYPLKRVGERGEGKFERISWDEALDAVATKIAEIKEKYGPQAILNMMFSGAWSSLHSCYTLPRFLNLFGGSTQWWGGHSLYGAIFGTLFTLGDTPLTGNEREDYLNSRLIVMWGWNPSETVWGTNTSWFLAQAKERGTKIICIDPRFHNSAAALADQWIAIRPSTDAAMAIAMAYVMVRENLQDQAFLEKYTIGFDKYVDYLVGNEDGVPKTPSWAAERLQGRKA